MFASPLSLNWISSWNLKIIKWCFFPENSNFYDLRLDYLFILRFNFHFPLVCDFQSTIFVMKLWKIECGWMERLSLLMILIMHCFIAFEMKRRTGSRVEINEETFYIGKVGILIRKQGMVFNIDYWKKIHNIVIFPV